MKESFKSVVDKASSILVLLPRDPYFDQVAAGLSLYLTYKEKKEVLVACPTPMVVEYNRLVGVQKVTTEIGSKNLVIKFQQYQPEQIEKVSYDIDNGEFRLTIVPKAQAEPPKKEQVEVLHSGISPDLVILIGGLQDKHFPFLSLPELSAVKLTHIGIQEISLPGREVLSFARATSSISEIVTELINDEEVAFDADVATNLLMGVHEGTRGFTHPEVNAETFRIASDLMRAGGRHIAKDKVERKQFPTGAIPQQIPAPTPNTNPNQNNPAVTPPAPASWLTPKIYKGTSIS